MASLSKIRSRARRLLIRLARDRSGIAATEFAVILPMMLVMLFGTIEITSGVSADRKVTLVARTLSDLVSQATTVTDSDMKNVFSASYGVLSPFSTADASATITEVYINTAKVAKVQWSKSGTVSQSGTTVTASLTTSTKKQGDTVTIPAGLVVANTYLIMSEVSYTYKPVIGYVVAKAGINLADTTYTRPRQSACVLYGTSSCPTN